MSSIPYPLNKADSGKKIGDHPIFYSPLSVTLRSKIRYLDLTEASFSRDRKLRRKWLRSAGLILAIGTVLVGTSLLYAGRQAQKATAYSAMTELAGARIITAGDMQLTVAAMTRAAEQDVLTRQARLDHLVAAGDLPLLQRAAFAVERYMSYGRLSRQDAVSLERQQLAGALDALDRCETASTRHATKHTRELAQN